jgi:ribonucleotide reductase beta subunit family protein with ferritin-like domain
MTNILTKRTNDRFILFPIQYEDIWNMYKLHESNFWTAEEIDLSVDQKEWTSRLTKDERHFVKMVLAFFAGADGIVMENLACRFMNDVTLPEARSFYSFQIMMENIHAETYALFIETLIENEGEKQELFRAIETVPVVSKKADWAKEFIESTDSFATRLFAFAIVEGIFFSGSFCAIFWLKKRGLMPGLTFSNELIAKDEGLHTDFACLLYNKLPSHAKLNLDQVQNMITKAVAIEHEFICEALSVDLIGINADMMKMYIQFVADNLVQSIGYPKMYNVTNPFPWMELISLQGKTNFFEKRVGDYQKANLLTAGQKASDKPFVTTAEF